MKKGFTTILLFGLCALIFSCSRADLVDDIVNGGLSLSISVGDAPQTKAAMSEEQLLASAKVMIYKADFSGLVREYVNSEMPSTLYLPADKYRVDVEAGEMAKTNPQTASWDQMSWKGSTEVTVSANTSTSAIVTAMVCNVISKVLFDSTVAECFEGDYSLTIGTDLSVPASCLTYTSAQSGNDGFFLVKGFEPSLFWKFSGTLKKDGTTITRDGEITAVEGGKRYVLGLKYTETDGLLNFSVLVDDSVNVMYDNLTFEATSTGISESSRYEIWAGHFTAHADVDESEYDKDNVFFEIRPAGSTEWVRVAGTRESEGTYNAVFSGLAPETEYEYRLAVTPLSGGAEELIPSSSNVITEEAPMIPNPGFETVSNAEDSKYVSLYDPASSDPTLQSKWWDTGNKGSTTVGSSYVICYPETSDFKEGSQSMCLQSRYVVIKFAAGNLFSGRFGSLVGTSGGTVYFGRPFTGRPTALRLWVKYSGGIVNRVGSGTPSELIKEGDYDKADIKIALGTWDYRTYGGDAESPICVNTTDTSTFMDYSTDPSTIAFGQEIITSDAQNSTNEWRHVTIPLNYRNTSKQPTHIVISMAASMYGDYFSGYDDSHLWVDGLELLYE